MHLAELENKHKKPFEIKSIEVHRSASVQIAGKWQRYEYGIHIDILDEEKMMKAKIEGEHFVDWCIKRRMDRGGLEQRADLNWKPESIVWVSATGPKGEYSRSYDRTNPEYKRIFDDLKSLKQPFEFSGYIYWILGDNTLGRKKIATKAQG